MDGFTLTVCQRKGGVGRSTLLFGLAGSMARRGLRVCIADLDPQASASQLCLSPEIVDSMPANRTVAAILGDDLLGPARDLVMPTEIPGVSLIPGGNATSRFNYPEPEKAGAVQFTLRDALEELRGDFDVILCDTPPSLETLSWVPAVAADVAITPTPAEPMAVQELAHAARFLERVRWASNPKLVWIGVVLTMMSKAAIHSTYEKALRDAYGDLVTGASIPYNVAFKEVALARRPLSHWKPKGNPAKSVDAVADEILARVARIRAASKEVAA